MRLKLDELKLRELRSNWRVKRDGSGKPVFDDDRCVVLEPNPSGRAWWCLDATRGAPVGFSLYVGKLRCTYVMQRKINGKVKRWKVCDVLDCSLAEAHDLAEQMVQVMLGATKALEHVMREGGGACTSDRPASSEESLVAAHAPVKDRRPMQHVGNWQQEILEARQGVRARVSAKTAACYLSVHYKTLEAWRKEGTGPRFFKNVPGRGATATNQRVFYALEELDAYLATCQGDSVTRALLTGVAHANVATERLSAATARKVAENRLQKAKARARRVGLQGVRRLINS